MHHKELGDTNEFKRDLKFSFLMIRIEFFKFIQHIVAVSLRKTHPVVGSNQSKL